MTVVRLKSLIFEYEVISHNNQKIITRKTKKKNNFFKYEHRIHCQNTSKLKQII